MSITEPPGPPVAVKPDHPTADAVVFPPGPPALPENTEPAPAAPPAPTSPVIVLVDLQACKLGRVTLHKIKIYHHEQ